MLILTVVLVGGGFYLVTGWVVDEISECRRDREPKRKSVHRRPPVWARLLDAYLAGAREMAAASALLKGQLHHGS